MVDKKTKAKVIAYWKKMRESFRNPKEIPGLQQDDLPRLVQGGRPQEEEGAIGGPAAGREADVDRGNIKATKRGK